MSSSKSQVAELSSFGLLLKYFRESANLTQAQLSEKSGVNRGQISQYEAEIKPVPKISVVKRLADALDREVADLIPGDSRAKAEELRRISKAEFSRHWQPSKLSWYFDKAGISVNDLAAIVGASLEEVELWLSGDVAPKASQVERVKAWYAEVDATSGGPSYEEATSGPLFETLSHANIPHERRPADADRSTLARSRFGRKNDYVLTREALYEMEQAQEQYRSAMQQMNIAQARLAAATERVTELMRRQGN